MNWVMNWVMIIWEDPSPYGRGFSVRNVWQMKAFYLTWPIPQTMSAKSSLSAIACYFSLPWSAYVRLLANQLST